MTSTWALAFFLLYQLEANATLRRRFLLGFYGFVGLSLLAKGLVGIVIPFGVVGTYFIFRRRLPERNTVRTLFWGIPLTLMVAALWYAPVIWKHGWPFVDQFFIQQHFARFVTNKYHHPGPVYYYLLILIPLSLPWTAFFIDGFLGIRTWLRLGQHAVDPLSKVIIFTYAWFLFPLIFFSVSSSKLPGYILPALPAGALIVGERLTRIINDSSSNGWALRATGGLCFLIGMVTPASAWRSGNLSLRCAVMIAVPLVVAGIFSLAAIRARLASILLIAVGTMAVVIVGLHCVGPFAERESAKRLIQLADARGYSQTPIYGLQRDDRTPEFYAAGRVVYGADGEPEIYIGPPQLVNESRRRNEVLLAFVPLADVSALMGANAVHTELIGDNGRYALVAVRGL
jgi:4-amino-4-deoxy-L-arabinose transferase-like glycosyltransferase